MNIPVAPDKAPAPAGSETPPAAQVQSEAPVKKGPSPPTSVGPLALGMRMEDVLTVLGKPASATQEIEMGADGRYWQDFKWPSQGVAIGAASDEAGGSKTVDRIHLTPPSKLKTPEGIGLGSTEASVIAAYGALKEDFSTKPKLHFTAGSIYGGAQFEFTNGLVRDVFLGASAE